VESFAFDEIKMLSEKLQAPIFSTITGKGIAIEDGKNLYFGTIGLFGEKQNHSFLRKNADLIIVVGNRLTEDDTANFKFPPSRIEMIHIDLEPAEIGLNFKCWGVVGDPKGTVNEILKDLKDYTPSDEILSERRKNIEKLRESMIKNREKDQKDWIDAQPIKPQRVLKAIWDIMKDEDYLVTDASASSRWIGPYFPAKTLGRNIITPRGVGPTGFGPGAALGTGIAIREVYSDRNKEDQPKIILFTGDGGLMNAGLSDLETLKNLDINCTIVVINNKALGFVKFGQGMMFKHRFYDTDRGDTNFVKIVEAFGGIGKRVENLSELDTTMKEMYNLPGLKLIDVMVDPKELLPPNFY
jgi:acetolactate synthase-1/2/3 large subunit